ncbi:DgyrCDS8150 [Dimorphilus gyrociliatus]|uniref:DgyrCDS8150 n=1 Tax=Dimorphilus gyrociliatus TaxID=2664684 RepID=A0A7I8VUY9_9ANNE|nr:DgyrCDS8150 [Dimorphilus gyrociliatus]
MKESCPNCKYRKENIDRIISNEESVIKISYGERLANEKEFEEQCEGECNNDLNCHGLSIFPSNNICILFNKNIQRNTVFRGASAKKTNRQCIKQYNKKAICTRSATGVGFNIIIVYIKTILPWSGNCVGKVKSYLEFFDKRFLTIIGDKNPSTCTDKALGSKPSYFSTFLFARNVMKKVEISIGPCLNKNYYVIMKIDSNTENPYKECTLMNFDKKSNKCFYTCQPKEKKTIDVTIQIDDPEKKVVNFCDLEVKVDGVAAVIENKSTLKNDQRVKRS